MRMAQVTWRAPDELIERVKRAAADRGRSLNDYVSSVLDAATDPALAGDEAAVMRERLQRAGLLAPSSGPRPRPPDREVAKARARAGRGTPLSEIVSRDR
jgi:hypothetical protein